MLSDFHIEQEKNISKEYESLYNKLNESYLANLEQHPKCNQLSEPGSVQRHDLNLWVKLVSIRDIMAPDG